MFRSCQKKIARKTLSEGGRYDQGGARVRSYLFFGSHNLGSADESGGPFQHRVGLLAAHQRSGNRGGMGDALLALASGDQQGKNVVFAPAWDNDPVPDFFIFYPVKSIFI